MDVVRERRNNILSEPILTAWFWKYILLFAFLYPAVLLASWINQLSSYNLYFNWTYIITNKKYVKQLIGLQSLHYSGSVITFLGLLWHIFNIVKELNQNSTIYVVFVLICTNLSWGDLLFASMLILARHNKFRNRRNYLCATR